MSRDRRFFAGLVGVAAVVSYLIYTGISDTLVYYLTPAELLARVEASPETIEQGVKVSGMLVPHSYSHSTEELLHRFVIEDPNDTSIRMNVEFRHPLPDTFDDSGELEVEVVMQGRYRSDGVFEATEVLTKCGSRYEAMPELPQAARDLTGVGGRIG
jgi:cytochrome c-type biogenesis protein CcmE